MENLDSSSAPLSGPPGTAVVGHLPAFLRDKLGFLSRCATQYGDVVKLHLGAPTYLLNAAEDIEHVLVKNPRNYEKSPRLTSRRGKQLSGEGLLTTTAAAHLRQRRLLQPLFHRKVIARFAKVMVNTAQLTMRQWQPGTILNIAAEMMNLAQRVLVDSLLSQEPEDERQRFMAAVTIRREYMRYIFFSLLPFPEYWPTVISWRYRQASRFITPFLLGAIQARRKTKEGSYDLLSMLVGAEYDDASSMTDKQVHDEALTLAITGYETIGEALTWTLYLLAQHPQVEQRLLAEVRDVLGERPPTVEDVPRLRYTEMVLSESMRLYPPTWIFVRIASQADNLPSGVVIPAGAKIYLCQYVTHRNPRYFPEPEQFRPERFREDSGRAWPKLAYFPFGGGPRLCIGESFALLEGVLVLAAIVQRWHLTLIPGQAVIPEPWMTLTPRNGILMQGTPR